MTTSRIAWALGLLLTLSLAGCGASSDADAGAGSDAGAFDAAVIDAGGEDGGADAGTAADDAGGPDAGADDAGPDDAGRPDAGRDAGTPDAGPPLCGVGAICSDGLEECPDGQRCYGHAGNGFCADPTPECGGFVMTDCTGGRVCLRGGGGSLGYCATAAEEICICDAAARAGISVDGCR